MGRPPEFGGAMNGVRSQSFRHQHKVVPAVQKEDAAAHARKSKTGEGLKGLVTESCMLACCSGPESLSAA
jgi:hypothetical protein